MVVRLTAVFMSLSDNMHQMASQLECVTRQINTVTASMKKWVFYHYLHLYFCQICDILKQNLFFLLILKTASGFCWAFCFKLNSWVDN